MGRLLLLHLTVLSRSSIVVIDVFGDVFVLSCFSVDVGAFVIGLSQISSFFSYVLLSGIFHYIMGTLTFHTNGFEISVSKKMLPEV